MCEAHPVTRYMHCNNTRGGANSERPPAGCLSEMTLNIASGRVKIRASVDKYTRNTIGNKLTGLFGRMYVTQNYKILYRCILLCVFRGTRKIVYAEISYRLDVCSPRVRMTATCRQPISSLEYFNKILNFQNEFAFQLNLSFSVYILCVSRSKYRIDGMFCMMYDVLIVFVVLKNLFFSFTYYDFWKLLLYLQS